MKIKVTIDMSDKEVEYRRKVKEMKSGDCFGFWEEERKRVEELVKETGLNVVSVNY